jgi:uncharacterized protein (TIGR02453 family)
LSIAPYKTNIGAGFPWIEDGQPPARRGRRIDREKGETNPQRRPAGGYFHFQPGEMFVGGGMWQMEKPRIEAFRALLVSAPERVRSALEDPVFVAAFGNARPHDELKRFPPGYPQDHPLAHMFRWKDVVFGRPLGDDEVLSPELPDRLAEGYAAAAPVFRLLASLD